MSKDQARNSAFSFLHRKIYNQYYGKEATKLYYMLKAMAITGEIVLSFVAYRKCINKAIRMVNDEGYTFVDDYIVKNILLKKR